MRIFFFDGRRHFGFRNTIETFLSIQGVRHVQRRGVVAPLRKSLVFYGTKSENEHTSSLDGILMGDRGVAP
jgi:hypothetical protein